MSYLVIITYIFIIDIPLFRGVVVKVLHKGSGHTFAAFPQTRRQDDTQSQGKQQEYYANVASQVNTLHVCHTGHIRHIRRSQESRHDITQDHRLSEPLEEQRHDTRAHQNQGKVCYQRLQLGHNI